MAAFCRSGLNFTKRAFHTVKKGMDFTIPFLFSINKECNNKNSFFEIKTEKSINHLKKLKLT